MKITNEIRNIKRQLDYMLNNRDYVNNYYDIFEDCLASYGYDELKQCLKRHNIKEKNLERVDWIEYVKPVFTQDYTQHNRCILSVPVGEFEIGLEHTDYTKAEKAIIGELTGTTIVRGFAYYIVLGVEFLLDVEQFKNDLKNRELAMQHN